MIGKINGESLQLDEIDRKKLEQWIASIPDVNSQRGKLYGLKELLQAIEKMLDLYSGGMFTEKACLMYSVQANFPETETTGIDLYYLENDQFQRWADAVSKNIVFANKNQRLILQDLHQTLLNIAKLYQVGESC